MIILNSIAKLANAYRTYAKRTNALRQLRRLSPRELADIGIEPYQLEVGVINFLWNEQGAVPDEKAVAPMQLTEAKPANNFANTMITLYSAWGRPVRNW